MTILLTDALPDDTFHGLDNYSIVFKFYFFGNFVKPREMPRPSALTGITVQYTQSTFHEMAIQKELEGIAPTSDFFYKILI